MVIQQLLTQGGVFRHVGPSFRPVSGQLPFSGVSVFHSLKCTKCYPALVLPLSLKFLGLTINDSLTWNTHIDGILPKLSSACFAICLVKLYVSQ